MICFDPAFGPYLAHAAGVIFNRDADTVLCRIERGELLGGVLFTDYMFAFEVTSILIIAAMVGAVVLARKREE